MDEIMKSFEFEGKNIQILDINNEPWWVAKDICDVLSIENVTQAVERLEEDEKLPYILHRAGQDRSVNIISESGVYRLLFSSKKEEAKRFTRWVTHDILPSIRKTGKYNISDLENAVEAEINMQMPVLKTQMEIAYAHGAKKKILIERIHYQKEEEIIMHLLSKNKKLFQSELIDKLPFMDKADMDSSIYHLLDKEKIDHKTVDGEVIYFRYDDMETRKEIYKYSTKELHKCQTV